MSAVVGLITTLLSLSVLGVNGVGWITLALACTSVPAEISIVDTCPVTLNSAVAPLPAMNVAVYSASVLLL